MSDSDECRRSDRFTHLPLGTEADASPALAFAETGAELGGQEGAAGEIPSSGTGAAAMVSDAAASEVSAIKSVHFTQRCPKPWFCAKQKVRGEIVWPGWYYAAHCGYRHSLAGYRAGTFTCGRIFRFRCNQHETFSPFIVGAFGLFTRSRLCCLFQRVCARRPSLWYIHAQSCEKP